MSFADLISGLAEKTLQDQQRDTGDYEHGGLLFCGKCRTPRQKLVTICGQEMLVGVMCTCRKAAYEAEAEEADRVSWYYEAMQRLEDYDLHVRSRREHCHPYVLRYLENWERHRDHGTGLLLWGDVGTGKTASAAYLVSALRQMHVPALITNFARFGDVRQPVQNLSPAELLVLDDLGAERQSEFMGERVFEIVDARVRCGKPVVYTTNLALDELKNPKDMRYKRLYSRVLEKAIPVRFLGKDHRKEHHEETVNMAMVGEL